MGCAPKYQDTTETGPILKGNAGLLSGPMVGFTYMRESRIWVQTKTRGAVMIEYWDSAHPDAKKRSAPVQANAAGHYIVNCIADDVEPGITYDYQVFINGEAVKLSYPAHFKTPPLWQWRSDPPAMTIAAGSCLYINEEQYDRPGKPYGSDYNILQSLAKEKPDLMLWLGDNVYAREPDFYTRTGMIKRYTHDRALPELQPLLAATINYAIWDDHDYGPNDSGSEWILKEDSWDIFKMFWANPTYGINGQKGCTSFFSYGDVDFFLVDDRYFRTPNHCKTCTNRTMIGEAQMNWLLGSLSESRAPFKIVAIGGQVLTTNKASETYINFFPAERDTLLNRIARENVKGVVFLTGDRHFTELSALKNSAGNWMYDLTTSPLTAGVYADAAKEINTNRVEGTLVTQHNYALMKFSGPRTNRQMQIVVCDMNGKELWTKTITQEGLK